jgi:hypothetical protein
MQGYNKGSLGPFLPVHYNGHVEASMQGYIVRAVWGPFSRSIIMAYYRSPCKSIVMEVWGSSYLSIILARLRPLCKAVVRAVWGPLY